VTTRFGKSVVHRLEQALGRVDEPISPRQPPVVHQVHLAFAEPIARPEDIAAATRHLLDRLAAGLERQRLGVRRLVLAAFRLDASVQRLAIGTSRPSREPGHLLRLLNEPMTGLDAGFGIEMLRLSAPEVGPLNPLQAPLAFGAADPAEKPSDDFARLLDTLGNRLGFDRVIRFASRQSHLPERAVRRISAASTRGEEEFLAVACRPLRLFARPEAVEAMAPVPDAPPLLFRWRRHTHRIRRAEGPERLSTEWWRRTAADRDYYCVEDEKGRRFWLYREGLYGDGPAPRWFVHGIFA
jgi:protein ImuB